MALLFKIRPMSRIITTLRSPSRCFSKASEAFDKEFSRRTPVKYILLAEFHFFENFPTAGSESLKNPKSIPEMNHKSYLEGVQSVISNFEHQTFRSIPFLNPGLPGSVNSWGEMAFHTKTSTCFLLCGMFNLMPVCVRTDKIIVVLSEALWKDVKDGYFAKIEENNGLVKREHNFGSSLWKDVMDGYFAKIEEKNGLVKREHNFGSCGG